MSTKEEGNRHKKEDVQHNRGERYKKQSAKKDDTVKKTTKGQKQHREQTEEKNSEKIHKKGKRQKKEGRWGEDM